MIHFFEKHRQIPRAARFFAAAFLMMSTLLSAVPASAQFFLSAGASYSQSQLPTSVGTGHAVYQGPGFFADARLRLLPSDFSSDFFGIDVFGTLGLQLTKNVGVGIDESNSNRVMGFGADFRISDFFVGLQYLSNSSTITLTGASRSLSYSSFGARVGYNLFSVSGRSSTLGIIGASAQFGTLDVGGSTSSVIQYCGFLQFGFDLTSLFSSGY